MFLICSYYFNNVSLAVPIKFVDRKVCISRIINFFVNFFRKLLFLVSGQLHFYEIIHEIICEIIYKIIYEIIYLRLL